MSTVVITGGSRGIGAAAVEAFAARGDRVYFLYEKNHEAAAAVAAKTGATPISLFVVSLIMSLLCMNDVIEKKDRLTT